MGASSSSDEAARARAAAELQRQREALDAERRRLEQVALAQHWAATRMQEEQRQKETAEKWRREQQLKAEEELQRKIKEMKMQQRQQAEEKRQKEAIEKSRLLEKQLKAEDELQRKVEEAKIQQLLQAVEQRWNEAVEKSRREEQLKAELELQRKVEEFKMQERSREEEQKKLQQQEASAMPAGKTSTSVGKTVPDQQTVSPCLGKAGNAPYLATAAPPMRSPEPSKSQASPDTNEPTVCKPKPKKHAINNRNPSETRVTQINDSKVRHEEWSIADYVMEKNALNKSTAMNVMKLLDDAKTVSFIARYRRAMTQGMEEDELRNVKKSYERAKQIKQRALSMTKAMEKQEEWTPELRAFVNESKSLRDLDRVDSIFTVTETKDVALETMAKDFLGGSFIFLPDIHTNPRLLADPIRKDIRVFNIMKKLRSKYDTVVETNFVVTNEPVTMQWELQRQKYLRYDNFKSTDKLISNTDISNIRRGESEKVLTVKINTSPVFGQVFKDCCLQLHIAAVNKSTEHKEQISAAIDYVYDTWARPMIEKWTREEIYEKAEIATMETIVQNVKRILLAPALGKKVVIGVFSLSQWICQLAAVSERGDYLDSETVYFHYTHDAETKLVCMVKKYKCTTLAVGNGAACKENKKFILNLIKKKSFSPLEVYFTVVDEAGLLQQFYSFRNEDVSEFLTIAAVSIARRLQDPMSEFVKIEPKYLVGKTHQQDVPEMQLTATLNDVSGHDKF